MTAIRRHGNVDSANARRAVGQEKLYDCTVLPPAEILLPLYGWSVLTSVWSVVVLTTVTWSYQLPLAVPSPVLASVQLIVTCWPDCGLLGVMASPVTCKSG